MSSKDVKLHEDVVLNASRPVEQTNVGSTSQWWRETRVRRGGAQGWAKNKNTFFLLKFKFMLFFSCSNSLLFTMKRGFEKPIWAFLSLVLF